MKSLILTQNKISLIDDEDYELVSKHNWCVHKNKNRADLFYAKSRINGKNVLLHRFILNPIDDLFIDHINGNGLDNRRENLRIVTDSLNKLNRRSCKGYNRESVYENGKEYPGFRVKMNFNGKCVYRKWVETEEEAIFLANTERKKLKDNILGNVS